MSFFTVNVLNNEQSGFPHARVAAARKAEGDCRERHDLRVQLSTGSATRATIMQDQVINVWTARGAEYLIAEGTGLGGVVNVDLPNLRWLELKWSHFTRAGREPRIKRALAALHRAAIRYELNAETIKWIAEDPDLEDF
jgi:hypothetical protein